MSVFLKAVAQLAWTGAVLMILLWLARPATQPATLVPQRSSAPVTVKSFGPTVSQLEGMGELTSVRIVVTDVLSAEGDGYRGVWLIKGDVLLSCDMTKAVVMATDAEKRQTTIRLPQPQVLSARVDHSKTRTWSVEKATWIPWRWGDEDQFRDSAMCHAQKLVEAAGNSDEHVAQARSQTELVIRKAFSLADWNAAIVWQ